MADFPTSFRDPVYASLDAATEQKLDLPPGLLSSIRTNGERSNADQVSSAGAKTPYQITPSTRELAIKQYGIDPYLSPHNASEVAGKLLQESLQRNQGDPTAAVGEYIGGTDRKNWGPTTKAYIARVVGSLEGSDAPRPQVAGMQGPSTFDKAFAQQQAADQANNQLGAIYQAYKAGQMSPDEAKQYEGDVRAGRMMLPQGGTLNDTTQGPGTGGASSGQAQPVPPGVLQAYTSGQMTPQEMTDFANDVRAGAWQLPPGVDANALLGDSKPQGVVDKIKSIPGALAEAVTGAQRRTATTDALPDWSQMPELNIGKGANGWGDFGGLWAKLKTGAGTMFASNPQEIAQIIQANAPGVKVDHDGNGNVLLTSQIDGKTYAIKPGLQVSDVPRIAGNVAAFVASDGIAPAAKGAGLLTQMGREALIGGGTQAAIDGVKAGTGGNFDAGNVAAAGALGGAAPIVGKVIDAAATPVRAMLGRGAGAAPDVAAAPAVAEATPAAAPSTVQSVAQTAKAAAEGSKSATEELAAAAAPNPKTTAAAQRLGIEDYLQPDHVTTNDAYRQVVGVLKSNPTGALALSEKEGLTQVAQRASNLVDEVGGTSDLSQLDTGVKKAMEATHQALSDQEDELWQKLRDTIPKTTDTPATNTLQFLQQRAAELGGSDKLEPFEKQLLAKLSPKTIKGSEDVPGLPGGTAPTTRSVQVEQQPTYALMDAMRQQAGRMSRLNSAFSDADTGLAKKYYELLTSDQEAVANQLGAGDVVLAAKAATIARKGMEDDLSSLFGKRLDQSMLPQLSSGMKQASQGNTAPLLAVLKATPDEMKQQVVASGLQTVFRNATTRGEINFTGYAKWYEGLLRNKQAYAAVMSNLPQAARKQLSDLYRVSKGISDSLNARIKTGLRSSVLDEMQAPDSLASRLFELAKHAGKGLAVDSMGGHGAGLAMGLMSALKGNAKPNALKAIDELLTSPEFADLARKAGTPDQTQAVRSLAYSKSFSKFARAVGNPRELSNRERWVLSALQAQNNQGAQ